MKIFIYSSVFYPYIGGLETVMLNLAHEFVAHGHDVKVATQSPTNEVDSFPFEVIRCPTISQLLNLTLWCDLSFHGCISLKAVWPVLLLKKPLVVTHQTWYRYPGTKLTWPSALKHWMTRFTTNIAPSQAIADQLPAMTTVIPNSYQDDVFYEMPEITRNQDLVFLGRLVSDKGADLLLNSLALLNQQGLEPNLTIIGQGPEEDQLKQQAQTLRIADQVKFVGTQRGEALARLLNAHKILVVPSKWQEPFGIVALEGIACGCVVVGSKAGGLKDAIGSCGVTFSNESVEDLTKILAELLTNLDQFDMYQKHREAHLIKHCKGSVAKAYLQVMEAIVQ
ncbi:glycosyltransferase family 4 protein [Nostocaceae cyanobacterium CENA357]|uniref:Glycosyltransferase family 4 protein n=1 Tax=Atlanticothrix silvestris CENA357 TaxID=1725252 RepID=A0A8J7HGP6_9CYAN|nr:glycosyltransferase family 4 protein [Atlanticothrix silvestris]MBH8555308.1 glycosyltransferase family 4 protein [Atlanticothrix silvestris CENA357]